ncbi:MAG TPA: PDZ domain-containing protein [Gemmatimonadaceae bacterium]|jgi:predicted metalloprotease with PDZ domain|nr:PDZ domain-containing protein [Gemmatimonadaceae bacterium]
MKLFWLALVPSVLTAQVVVPQSRSDSVSAPIRDVRYDVTFMRANAQYRVVDVSMTFMTSGTSNVVLSLPSWTPGAYEISNYARWLGAFEATGDGAPLSWDKLDFEKWRIRPAGAKSIRVSFRYRADSLDNAMSWAKPDFLLFNGTNLFLYPEGQPSDFPATVAVHTESDWRSVSAMTPGPTRGMYTASNYHDLVDMPFFVGRFDLDSTRILDRWVRFASYPVGAVTGAQRIVVWDQLKHVIPPEAAVFGEVPWQSYTVMEIADSTYGGASGLEHQNSHVDIFGPAYLGGEFQPSLYAHEIFHSWNVKRLRPAEMWPYDYSRPQPTPWLWVSEGITDYYADLAELRGGLVDEKGFYSLTAGKLNEVAEVGWGAVSLEDASLNAWIHPVDGTEFIYYPKGSLAGLLLDIMIRDGSDNAHSLDDVMRGLYQSDYKHSRGFTASDWWSAVSAAAGGKSFAAFSAKYIDGRAPFPIDSIFPLAGLRAKAAMVPRLGVMTSLDSNGVVVSQVQEGSAAAAAGVRAGDYLLTVGDVAVQDAQFGARLRAKFGASVEGSPLPIKVRRGSETITLPGKLRFGPGDLMVERDPGAGPKAVRIRNGILKGTTG